MWPEAGWCQLGTCHVTSTLQDRGLKPTQEGSADWPRAARRCGTLPLDGIAGVLVSWAGGLADTHK